MKNRRHTLLVDKVFQYSQISKALLSLIIVGNIVLAGTLLSLKSEATRLLDITDASVLAVVELLVVGAVFYLGLKATHRIAGPAVAVKRALDRLGRGDLTTTVRLRKDDHLQDIASSFNANVAQLNERLRVIQSLAASLIDTVGDNEQARLIARNLEQALAELSVRNE